MKEIPSTCPSAKRNIASPGCADPKLPTASGSAGAVTEALDQAGWSEVIGTIAGDDTVLVITRSQKQREAIASRINGLVRK